MRIVLNLASQPFIELRPLYARLRLWMALLFAVAVPLGLLLRMEQRREADADARMQRLQTGIGDMQAQQAGFQETMRESRNAAVLSQADFLNQLFARKAFSWTAVMMDLEDVLPAGVQVMNIDPIVAPDGHVTIRIRVAGPRDRSVELVRNLEHSHRFLMPRLASEAAETSTGSGGAQAAMQPVSATTAVNFDILADYNPLPNAAMVAAQIGATGPAATKPKHQAKKTPGARSSAAPGTAASGRAPAGGAR